jgi:argininosuccinate lyase
VASYEQALQRDTARLLDAYERVNQSPLGAAAFAGTPFDVDRDRTAELLGFDGVVENAMDAASARDFLVETTAALAGLATTVSGLSEDVVVFANKGYVELDDDYASTSSIMPQKKNPDTLELARARAGDASTALDGLLTTLKGLPRAYNRDLQRATGYAWDAVDDVPAGVEVAVGAVATADWPEDELEAAAAEGFSTATGVADLLAMSGVPFRTAHEVVAEAAAAADGSGDDGGDAGTADGETPAGTPDYETLAAVTENVLGESLSAYVDREAVEAALDPAESVAMRDSRGGPAPEAVTAQLRTAEDRLAAHETAIGTHSEALSHALEALESEVTERV